MNRFKFNLIVAVTIAGLLFLACAQAEVRHRQINADNLIVDVSDDAWQPKGFDSGTSIPATYLKDGVINIDGRDDEPEWNLAPEVEVPLTYGETKTSYLKALYTDKEVFIRVRWADDNEDRQHHPWVWDSELKRYIEGPQVEDSVMLSFEAGCEWTPSLIGGYIYDYDAWHWQAARSDPLGQALDLYGNVQDQYRKDPSQKKYPSRVKEDVWNIKFTDNSGSDLHADWDELDRVYMLQPVTQTMWVRGEPDGKTPPPSYKQIPAPLIEPSDESQTFPQFSPVKLEGDAGEVSAKGQWENGYWTVEFRRDRLTPASTLTDTEFKRLTQFSVHVFDQTEELDQSSESGRLYLQFIPEEPQLTLD